MRHLILYTRHGCHLCEDFAQELQRVRHEQPPEHQFEVEVRDIDACQQWRAAYNDQVPLLLAGDEEISRYFLDLACLRRYLGCN